MRGVGLSDDVDLAARLSVALNRRALLAARGGRAGRLRPGGGDGGQAGM